MEYKYFVKRIIDYFKRWHPISAIKIGGYFFSKEIIDGEKLRYLEEIAVTVGGVQYIVYVEEHDRFSIEIVGSKMGRLMVEE